MGRMILLRETDSIDLFLPSLFVTAAESARACAAGQMADVPGSHETQLKPCPRTL